MTNFKDAFRLGLGLKVNMVIVQDDIAIPGITQPRGVAGTLFVHKITGATAEAGGNLDAVTAAAERAAGNVFSIGMSLGTCTMPGGAREDRHFRELPLEAPEGAVCRTEVVAPL